MSEPAPAASSLLEYGHPRPRSWRRLVAVGLLVSLLVGLVWWAGPGVIRWSRDYREWRSTMAFSPRMEAVALAAKRDETHETFGKIFAQRTRPSQFDRVEQARDRILVNRPSSQPGSLTAVFHGPLKTHTGHRRFVSVGGNAMWAPDAARFNFDVRAFEVGGFFSPRFTEVAVNPDPELRVRGTIPNFPGQLYNPFVVPWGHDFQVFPAQRDPTNHARAVGRYVVNETEGRYVIELHDDDTVTLRNGEGEPLHVRVTPPEP